MATSNKGFRLEIVLKDGNKNTVYASSYAEAIYLVNRRYRYTPNLGHIGLYVGTKHLTNLGEHDMLTFAEFAKANPNITGRSFAKQADKEALVAFEVPFTIVGAIETETDFLDEKTGEKVWQINYDVDIDITSPTYQYASKMKEIASSYRLGLPSNAKRRAELVQLIQPAIAANTPVRAKLTKIGKGYHFADVAHSKD